MPDIDDLIDELASCAQELGSDQPALGAREDLAKARADLLSEFVRLETRIVELERLQARVDELEKAQAWVPVSERLPEKKGVYLFFHERKNSDTGTIHKDFYDPFWGEISQEYITHWMPLPPPPVIK